MRADWNDELRRAYDQGYWDARREFDHILNRSQMGGRLTPDDRGMGPGLREGRDVDGRSREYGPENLGRGGPGGDYGRGGDFGRDDFRRDGYGRDADYGPGSRRDMEHIGSYNRSERRGDQWYGERNLHAERHGYGEYPPGDRRSAFERGDSRGFLDRVGDEVRSWFGGDHDGDERRRYGGPDLNDRR